MLTSLFLTVVKCQDCVVKVFARRQNFGLVQIEGTCRPHNKSGSNIEIHLWQGRKHCWKRRKCWLPAFSPFPTMFSKVLLIRGRSKSALCGKQLNVQKH